VVILDFPLFDENRSACAIAELIGAEIPPSFSLIRLEQLPLNELSGQERAHLENLLEDRVNPGPLRIGWLDEARAWVQHATGRKHRAETGIEQYNAGRGFALIRFAMEDGHSYWLKATGNPNQHECGLTARLCELAPDCLPALVSIRREWNAWVSKDAGIPLCDTASPVILEFATCSLGFLQQKTMDEVDVLLAAGASDQRTRTLRMCIDRIIDYLIDAMGRQSSLKSAPLTRARLLELGSILRDVCLRVEALGIPDTLLHNDLNRANILFDGERCVIADWSEAGVGNPFLSFERLCRLSAGNPRELRAIYSKVWLEHLDPSAIDEVYRLMPLLAIYAYLYGRGDWINHTSTVSLPFESCARSLARHMDRAAQSPVLLETLCR